MPYFDFRCAAGHVAEDIVPRGTDSIECPSCHRKSERQFGVPSLHGLGTRPAVPRAEKPLLMREYREASETLEYERQKIEQSSGKPLPPDMGWTKAKRRAQAVLDGKAPPPKGYVPVASDRGVTIR